MTRKTDRVPDWVWAGIVGAVFAVMVVLAFAVTMAYIATIYYGDPTWLWFAIPGTLFVGFVAAASAEA